MNRYLSFMFFIMFPLICKGQYEFEKYPKLEYQSFFNWKTYENESKVDNTSTIPNFFPNGDEITIQLTSFKEHWFENSSIRIFRNKNQIIHVSENMGFPPIGLDSVRVADINGDGLKDLKLICPYMGNGLASLNVRVIYLIQKPNNGFTKISFDDKMDFRSDRRERDFDGDGKYEIITMQVRGFEKHNYWVFNLYNLVDNKLVNANEKGNYPIMVQLLNKETFQITKNLSREKMKSFEAKLPEKYDLK